MVKSTRHHRHLISIDAKALLHGYAIVKQILHVNDFEKELDSLPAKPSYLHEHPPRSALFIPLLSGEEAVGILTAQSQQAESFRRK